MHHARMRDHKSLMAWQRSREVSLGVIRITRQHWQPWAAAMITQLQRASLSVQLNLTEGYALRSKGHLRNHLVVAHGSAMETVELLEMIRDSECVPESVVEPTLGKANETCALLLGLLKHYA